LIFKQKVKKRTKVKNWKEKSMGSGISDSSENEIVVIQSIVERSKEE